MRSRQFRVNSPSSCRSTKCSTPPVSTTRCVHRGSSFGRGAFGGTSRPASARKAPALLELKGCGTLSAARIIAECGDARRFPGMPSSRGSPGWRRYRPPRATGVATACTSEETASSTARSPDRGHPGAHPPPSARVPRPQASRAQDPPRSTALPQATARASHLAPDPTPTTNHPRPRRFRNKRDRLDIGATHCHRRRHGRRLAGESPVSVGAGAPGSRPQSQGAIPSAQRGVKTLFGGNKRMGCDCSLGHGTRREPSRSCHGEGQVRQSLLRNG